MTLNLVKEGDSGDYEVKATNKWGSAVSKAKVVVISKYTKNYNKFLQQKKPD